MLPSAWVSLVMPPIASFALRGTARELTWYCLVALTPKEAGIACTKEFINFQSELYEYLIITTQELARFY